MMSRAAFTSFPGRVSRSLLPARASRQISAILAMVLCAVMFALTAKAQSPAPSASTSPVFVNVYERLRSDATEWYADPPYTTTYPYEEQLLRVVPLMAKFCSTRSIAPMASPPFPWSAPSDAGSASGPFIGVAALLPVGNAAFFR